MVLASAAMGGAAFRVFAAEPPLTVVTTVPTLAEAIEVLPLLIERYGADAEAIGAQLAALPVAVVEEAGYSSHVDQARELLGARDPDDVPLLALALKLGVPIWSNDRDFEGLGPSLFPTAVLLKVLGV